MRVEHDIRCAARRGQKAFTLIELLVVTAILGLVIAAIAACLSGGLRVWETAQKFSASEATSILAIEEMERDLVNSFPFYAVRFTGSATEMSFPGLVIQPRGAETDKNGNDGFEKRIGTVKYFFVESAGSVVKKTWAYPGHEPQFASSQQMLSGVAGIRLAYYWRLEGKDAGMWQDTWSDPTNHPAAVRIEVFFGDGRDESSTIKRTVFLPVDQVKKAGDTNTTRSGSSTGAGKDGI